MTARPCTRHLLRSSYGTATNQSKRRPITRHFATTRARSAHSSDSFGTRLRHALNQTKIKWYPIPVGVGIAFLGGAQLLKINQRREEDRDNEHIVGFADNKENESKDAGGRPKKRERIRPSGPWQVQIMSTLPLKAISRVWGRFNELTIPYYLRVPGFKLYGWIFGVK